MCQQVLGAFKILQRVLENPEITKVMYDGAALVKALWWQHGVQTSRVEDITGVPECLLLRLSAIHAATKVLSPTLHSKCCHVTSSHLAIG